MENKSEPKLTLKETIFDGFFKVHKLELKYNDNQPFERYIVENRKATSILLFNPQTQKVVLLKQYRAPHAFYGNPYLYEIPAGLIEPNETDKEAAIREAYEESGYKIEDAEFVSYIIPSPGVNTERISLYYAEIDDSMQLGKGGGMEAEAEDISTGHYSIEEIKEMLKNCFIEDAKTLIALQWLLLRLS